MPEIQLHASVKVKDTLPTADSWYRKPSQDSALACINIDISPEMAAQSAQRNQEFCVTASDWSQFLANQHESAVLIGLFHSTSLVLPSVESYRNYWKPTQRGVILFSAAESKVKDCFTENFTAEKSQNNQHYLDKSFIYRGK